MLLKRKVLIGAEDWGLGAAKARPNCEVRSPGCEVGGIRLQVTGDRAQGIAYNHAKSASSRHPDESGHFVQIRTAPGSGVICEARALLCAVIPAKAGIHCVSHRKSVVDGLDSRFRGNDRPLNLRPYSKWHTTQRPTRLTGALPWT